MIYWWYHYSNWNIA